MDGDSLPQHRFGGVIGDDQSQVGLCLAQDKVIGLGSILNGEPMGGEVVEINPPRVDQFLEGLHVSVFCPADVTRRIIGALFFVVEIVPSRTVGTGHTEADLFFVIISPG